MALDRDDEMVGRSSDMLRAYDLHVLKSWLAARRPQPGRWPLPAGRDHRGGGNPRAWSNEETA